MGSGYSKPSILFTDTLEEKLTNLTTVQNIKKFRLHVHPYVYAYISKGLASILMRWKWKYSRSMKIIPDQSLGFLEYKFYDADNNEFEINDKLEIK
jgi:hypothetical protein